MEYLIDPSIWLGLLTLVMLEIILGIDNLVFIALLVNKLLSKQRDKVLMVGLSLALIMRLTLLSVISWMVTLTKPIFNIWNFSFSGRDIIMLTGGLFLVFKATTELHERLENNRHDSKQEKICPNFWLVVLQIVILDAVFSLDAVITAVGMVNDLPVMMVAVIIAMVIMILASKSLTQFVNEHSTIVVLCLSFLLMIGFNLVANGFGFYIPKGYLYAAISFSIIIELFNQVARRNFIKQQSIQPLRARTADAILRLMGGSRRQQNIRQENTNYTPITVSDGAFVEEERYMISSILSLASRSLRGIMTPRKEINWINANLSVDKIREQLLSSTHSLLPVCRGELDKIIGVALAKDILIKVGEGINIETIAVTSPAIIVQENLDLINLIGVLRRSSSRLIIVTNEQGVVQGLVTPLDVLEVIAGEFLNTDKNRES